MSRRELQEARGEITELRRLLRRVAPSGSRRSQGAQDAMWKTIRRLADHAQWLEFLSAPSPASSPVASSQTSHADSDTPTGAGLGGRSAQRPIFPGTWLEREDGRRGDRNIYYQGREYAVELQRLVKRIEGILDQSEDWLRGIDRATVSQLPAVRRPRCSECAETLAVAWRYCPYCSTRREALTG